MLFITLEDETEVVNLVVWPSLFERQRQVVLSAGLLACRGRVQREGEVIHLIAEDLIDLSDLLRSVGDRNEPFPVPHGRGDEAKHGAQTTAQLTSSGAGWLEGIYAGTTCHGGSNEGQHRVGVSDERPNLQAADRSFG